jgi:hypothetical protein
VVNAIWAYDLGAREDNLFECDCFGVGFLGERRVASVSRDFSRLYALDLSTGADISTSISRPAEVVDAVGHTPVAVGDRGNEVLALAITNVVGAYGGGQSLFSVNRARSVALIGEPASRVAARDVSPSFAPDQLSLHYGRPTRSGNEGA